MIFDRSFNTDGLLYMNSTGNNPTIHPQWQPEYFGDAIIVNGKAWPYLQVKRRKYRFLSLTNNLTFDQIGLDACANEFILTKDAPYPYPTGSPADQLNSKIMKFIFQPGAPNPPDDSKVPPKLKPYPTATTIEATRTSYITLYEYQSAAGTSTHL
ncbi:hypothetical protein NL676_029399 [Syzygium grande]|nr:hypothetical protein NL676_029399 [Syzygium grande]